MGKEKNKKEKKGLPDLPTVSSHCIGLNFILLIMGLLPSHPACCETSELGTLLLGGVHCQQGSNESYCYPVEATA